MKKKSESYSYLRDRRNILGAIERFALDGIYPDRLHRTNILRNSGYDHLSEEFKKVIDIYRNEAKERCKKDDTTYTESHNATTFLLSLQKKNITSLNEITEKAVLGVFFQGEKLCRGFSYKKNISAVFKTCISFFPDNTCARVLSYLPALHERRKEKEYTISYRGRNRQHKK